MLLVLSHRHNEQYQAKPHMFLETSQFVVQPDTHKGSLTQHEGGGVVTCPLRGVSANQEALPGHVKDPLRLIWRDQRGAGTR